MPETNFYTHNEVVIVENVDFFWDHTFSATFFSWHFATFFCFFFVFPVKKAYYRLSLQIHPDRVAESEKEEATEKFKVLTKINAVLTDAGTKALYDEQGIIDDDGDTDCNWLKLWREFFKPITTTDIENFHQKYIGKYCDSNFSDWI